MDVAVDFLRELVRRRTLRGRIPAGVKPRKGEGVDHDRFRRLWVPAGASVELASRAPFGERAGGAPRFWGWLGWHCEVGGSLSGRPSPPSRSLIGPFEDGAPAITSAVGCHLLVLGGSEKGGLALLRLVGGGEAGEELGSLRWCCPGRCGERRMWRARRRNVFMAGCHLVDDIVPRVRCRLRCLREMDARVLCVQCVLIVSARSSRHLKRPFPVWRTRTHHVRRYRCIRFLPTAGSEPRSSPLQFLSP